MATEGFKRKLTAVFSADVVGYSRLMEGRRTLSLERLDPVQEGLFVKLSWLFRM